MSVSALILAGGRAIRMGGIDKGLVELQSQPLIKHVIARLTPQVNEIMINANRELAYYNTLGYRVLQDEIADFAGPLAGMQLGLKHATHDLVLFVPCDSPLLPANLVNKLKAGLLQANADVAVATCGGNNHPVFCLCKKTLLPSLNHFLAQGNRKVHAWQKSQHYIEVDFGDDNDAFENLNSPDDIIKLESKLAQSSAH
ncbi:molybdenum cofactor guanylyltransferase MobA [Methylotenera sp.]|uniref:molybdenum cofactor guanylyltransferase MobA n=1 Tax=Methylotenera sp. TaxID=2051956 RepID=UPI002EDA494B